MVVDFIEFLQRCCTVYLRTNMCYHHSPWRTVAWCSDGSPPCRGSSTPTHTHAHQSLSIWQQQLNGQGQIGCDAQQHSVIHLSVSFVLCTLTHACTTTNLPTCTMVCLFSIRKPSSSSTVKGLAYVDAETGDVCACV